MTRLVPQISNGSSKLLFTETLCIDPSKGVRFGIPIALPNGHIVNSVIRFTFLKEPNHSAGAQWLTEDGALHVKLTNFSSSLPAGLTKPMEFQIGGVQFSGLFVGQVLTSPESGKETMLFTFTVYEGLL